MGALPPVDLVMVNWNAKSFLARSLQSLLETEYPDFSLYLIDNGSTDGSAQFVRHHFPEVTVHCNERNAGFAAGANIGLRMTCSEIAVLLNPDISVRKDWLRQLVSSMLGDQSIGIAGCKVYYPNGLLQHAGGYITYPRARPGHHGLNEVDKGQYNTLRDVDYVIGAALAVKRQVLNKIGLLDEGFFLYFEDVDLCVRARKAGFRVVYVPRAKIVHEESAVSHKGSDAYLEQMHASRWRFVLKHYDPEGILQDTVPAELAWLHEITGRHRRAAARAYALTLRHLSAIMVARTQDGDAPIKEVSEKERQQIAGELQTLRRAARGTSVMSSSIDSGALSGEERPFLSISERLKEKWQIKEQPFVSRIPVLGSFIARFREAWNSIAAKWFVRPLIQQQNEYNWLVMRGLGELDRSINDLRDIATELDERAIDSDREAMAVARDVGELTYAMIRLEKRLIELETFLKEKSAEKW